jgi:hypothetical protein
MPAREAFGSPPGPYRSALVGDWPRSQVIVENLSHGTDDLLVQELAFVVRESHNAAEVVYKVTCVLLLTQQERDIPWDA